MRKREYGVALIALLPAAVVPQSGAATLGSFCRRSLALGFSTIVKRYSLFAFRRTCG
jgi:hypothetical protein